MPPVSLPWKLAPGVPSVGTSTARASMPASRACVEGLAGGGDLGVGEGDPGRADAFGDRLDLAPEQVLGGDPGLVLAHVGEEGAAVDVADRVEPLAAADPHPRRRSSRKPCSSGSTPAELRGRARRCGGLRPTATRISSASTALAVARARRSTPAPPARDRFDLRRRCGRRRRSSRAAPRRLPRRRRAPRARAGARRPRPGSPWSRALDQACESSLPTGPPPSTIMLSGTRLAVVASRLFQALTVSRPSIGGIAAPLPVATTTALRRGQDVVADDAPGARRRSGPRRGRGRSRVLPARAAGPSRRGRGSPRRGGRGPPAGRARRAPPATPGTRRASASTSAGPQQRLRGHAGVVGAFAADQVALDDRHPQAAVGEAPGADLARRARRRARSRRSSLAHRPSSSTPTPYNRCAASTGATGFDVVDSCERLQVEVAGGLVKPRHKPIRADHEFALAA